MNRKPTKANLEMFGEGHYVDHCLNAVIIKF